MLPLVPGQATARARAASGLAKATGVEPPEGEDGPPPSLRRQPAYETNRPTTALFTIPTTLRGAAPPTLSAAIHDVIQASIAFCEDDANQNAIDRGRSALAQLRWLSQGSTTVNARYKRELRERSELGDSVAILQRGIENFKDGMEMLIINGTALNETDLDERWRTAMLEFSSYGSFVNFHHYLDSRASWENLRNAVAHLRQHVLFSFDMMAMDLGD